MLCELRSNGLLLHLAKTGTGSGGPGAGSGGGEAASRLLCVLRVPQTTVVVSAALQAIRLDLYLEPWLPLRSSTRACVQV